jgi:hypothetical protein
MFDQSYNFNDIIESFTYSTVAWVVGVFIIFLITFADEVQYWRKP